MIYLDHHATTPCDPRVVDAMLPYFTKYFGNASSPHQAGTQAAQAVDIAREQVAELIGARPGEIVFTGGATESNNLALLGFARAQSNSERKRIVITAVEHKSVSVPCLALQKEGFEIIVLPVNAEGTVSLDAAQEAITDRTLLVSIQAANGEIGTIQPVRSVAEIAHAHGAAVHCDAAQAVGKIPLDVLDWDVDFLSLSAHKIYGPKGVGALYVHRPRLANLEPIVRGGGQERGWRSGTLNVPGIVGLGEACRLCHGEMADEATRLAALRDDFEVALQNSISDLKINGAANGRLPHNSSITFSGLEADAILANMPDLALSSGSACDSGAWNVSATLLAIGLTQEVALGTIRVGFGRWTRESEIEQITQEFAKTVVRLREISQV